MEMAGIVLACGLGQGASNSPLGSSLFAPVRFPSFLSYRKSRPQGDFSVWRWRESLSPAGPVRVPRTAHRFVLCSHPFDSLLFYHTEKAAHTATFLYGDGGNRTRVRKPIRPTFSGRIASFESPPRSAGAQAHFGAAFLFMAVIKTNLRRTFVTDFTPPPIRDPPGKDGGYIKPLRCHFRQQRDRYLRLMFSWSF